MSPDFTACTGVECPLKKSCYRYTCKKYSYQSFFTTPPIKNGSCDYHMEAGKTHIGKIPLKSKLKKNTQSRSLSAKSKLKKK